MRLATLCRGESTFAAIDTADGFVEIGGFANVSELLRESEWHQKARYASGSVTTHDDALLTTVTPAPTKIFCVGLNYSTHILEMGRKLPEYPTIFAKFPQTLTGPTSDIVAPPEDPKMDWEAELAVVIGKGGRRIPVEAASGRIAGYTVANDISMRGYQNRTVEWLQGKVWDETTPLGPVLVTPDELEPDAEIATIVDGRKVQSSSIADLVFTPSALVSYISTITKLTPGDLILTGTPGGVGQGRQPQEFLAPGQVVETSVSGIGTLKNNIVKARYVAGVEVEE